jgi:DNA mismatch repair protein MutL
VTDALRSALGQREATVALVSPERAGDRPPPPAGAPDVSRRIAELKRYEEQRRDPHPPAWQIPFAPGDDAPAGAEPAPAAAAPDGTHAQVPEERVREVREARSKEWGPRHGIPENPTSILQVLNTFLVCATDEGMLIVDQHSAHERVNYERFRAAWAATGRNPDVQPLMFPEALKLDVQRVALLEEMAPFLERLGFELRAIGAREVLVNAVPAALGERSVTRALGSLMDAYSDARAAGLRSDEVGDGPTPLEDRLLMTVACHAAVKAGQPLADAEVRALWKELVRVDLAAHDVHGRPAVLALPGAEIARRMGRAL